MTLGLAFMTRCSLQPLAILPVVMGKFSISFHCSYVFKQVMNNASEDKRSGKRRTTYKRELSGEGDGNKALCNRLSWLG